MKNYCTQIIDSIITKEKSISSLVQNSIKSNDTLLLTYFNQYCFNVYCGTKEYAEVLSSHFKYYVDGVGIRRAYNYLKRVNVEKFNASDINDSIFKLLEETKLPVTVIGGRFSKELMDSKNLNVDLYLNGFEDVENYERTISMISDSGSRIIIIGMGVPKQELFAYNLSIKIDGLVIICVGNYLEFYFETIKRAPKVFHNSGFEWVYRIYTEPRRLWKRYLIGIPLFIFRIIKLKFKAHSLNAK